jgi:hypothetical protein
VLEDPLRWDFQWVLCGYLGDLTQKSGTAKDRQARTGVAAPQETRVRRHRIGHGFATKPPVGPCGALCAQRPPTAISTRLRSTDDDAVAADEPVINEALALQRTFCDTRATRSSALQRKSFKIGDVFALL